MKIFSFFIFFIFISKVSLAFDLKKLGDSLQKDLGGALKQLEKGVNPQVNTSPQGNISNNNSKPKLENDDKAVAKVINNLCVITYTASNGETFERKSTAINNCERDRRSFLLNDAKQIEKKIAYNKKLEKERKEREIQEAKEREEQRKKQEAEKKRKIAAKKKANKIKGFDDKQSSFIQDALVPYYLNYRNLKALCLEKGASGYAKEVKKLFKVMKQAVDQGEVKFPPEVSWEKITDTAWNVSTPKHKKWLKENGMLLTMYDGFSDSKRITTCKQKVIPDQLRYIRMITKTFQKKLNKKDVSKEKKAF